MKLNKNLCLTDRIVRLTLGIVCVYVGFIDTSLISNQIASVLIGLFGAINLYAFTVSSCPVYALAGLSTIKSEAASSEQ